MARRKAVARVGGQNVQFPAGDALLLTGALDDPAAVTLASAATVDIGAAASTLVRISGTAAITSLGTAPAGVRRKLLFTSSGVVLTYNATTLQLPTSANITAAVNDTVDAYSLGSGNWLLRGYQRFSGAPLSGASGNTNVFGELRTLPSRSITVPGIPYADGQLISSASTLYPDVVTNLKSATPSVPVTTPALWLSDPTLRACWAYDQANDQIRVPDLNGKASGSIGPLMFRPDGTLGFAPGNIRQDQVQGYRVEMAAIYVSDTRPIGGALVATNNGGTTQGPTQVGPTVAWGSSTATGVANGYPVFNSGRRMTDGTNGTPRTGTETFPTHFVGVWGVVLFGAVINAGSVDAAALATKVANLESSLSKAVFGEMRSLPSRNVTQPGIVYADGQLLNNASSQYPDAYAALQLATPPVPVTTPAMWLSDPTMRGCWAVDTTNNQIRLPDYNGKQAGSIGPVVFRADGTLGFAAGKVRRDQFQGFRFGANGYDLAQFNLLGGASSSGAVSRNAYFTLRSAPQASMEIVDVIADPVNGTPRTGTETFPTHVVGVWGVVLFGAVINAGAADAAALSTSYANLSSRVAALESATAAPVDYTIIYPNGGTEASPANAALGGRYVSANPFPGHPVICAVELLYSGVWERPGWSSAPSSTPNSSGAKADMRKTASAEEIVTQIGTVATLAVPTYTGGTFPGSAGSVSTPLPVRVHVWRVKG